MPAKKTTEVVKEATSDETTPDETISAKAIAAELGIDPKSFRRWLRRQSDDRAGKGGRWNFTAERAEELRAAYLKPADDATND